MIQGFKDFILRGNVVDLAVAVVIGAAFSAIITVVVDAIVNPLIALFFNADNLDSALQFTVPTIFGGTSTFSFGAVLAAIISFLAVALVVYFALVMPMNRMAERRKAKAGIVDDAPAPTQEELLTQIRDLLAKDGTPQA